jgi:hypothetical protein
MHLILMLDTIHENALPRLLKGLSSLADARLYAQMLKQNPWEFALQLFELRALGLTSADFRWLLHSGYILLRPQRKSAVVKEFGCFRGIEFKEEWLVILRDEAVEEVRRFLRPAADRKAGGGRPLILSNADASGRATVRFHAERRELFVGDRLVKRLPASARNQAAILEGFQTVSWQTRIANPLPAANSRRRAQQLRDTVHDLNAGQKPRRLRFHSDEKGRSIWWEFIPLRQPRSKRVTAFNSTSRHAKATSKRIQSRGADIPIDAG